VSASAPGVAKSPPATKKSVLEQLLHALNQPLTGLQCSMEVTLASPRASERYVQCLQQGLELTERMRSLVEAIREVSESEREDQSLESIDVKSVLRQAVEDLAPVAESKGVDLVLNCVTPENLPVRAERAHLARAAFRLLEAGLSLADRGSVLRVESGGTPGDGWVRVRWRGETAAASSRPELGLLMAQAGWERSCAEWERERGQNAESVTVHLRASTESGNS
jgi:signal transduction histidine kinase